MKTTSALIAVILSISLFCGIATYMTYGSEAARARATAFQQMKSQLLYPDTMQVKDVAVYADHIVCGKTSASNSLGMQLPYRHFMAAVIDEKTVEIFVDNPLAKDDFAEHSCRMAKDMDARGELKR